MKIVIEIELHNDTSKDDLYWIDELIGRKGVKSVKIAEIE